MTPDESTDSVRVAAVLGEHEWSHSRGRCACDWEPTYPDVYAQDDDEVELPQHRAHVAALLADVVAQAKAEERERIEQAIEGAHDDPEPELSPADRYYRNWGLTKAAHIAREATS